MAPCVDCEIVEELSARLESEVRSLEVVVVLTSRSVPVTYNQYAISMQSARNQNAISKAGRCT